ncbi:MAG: helix-turn-helix transcriptional regulator [Chryseobacterium sp.]
MKTQSNYLQNAKFRIENKKWLSYSSNITLRVLAAIEENEQMTQKALAEMIGVSPQYINKVLKGQENLSLQTIAKLSDALNVELITFPKFLFDEPINKVFKKTSSKSQLKKMEK